MEKKAKKLDPWKIALFVGIWIFGILLGSRLVMAFWPYPELDSFITRAVSTRYLDRAGQFLTVAPLPNGNFRESYLLKEYPETIIKVVLSSEDRNYYFHPGIDPIALLNGTGGETLTMQVARLINPTPHDFWGRLTEIVDALRLEARLDKGRILELYLNNVPFDAGREGFASAARYYFGKSAPDLLPAEAAILATLHHDPVHLSPLTHPEEAAQAGFKAAMASDLAGSIFAKTTIDQFQLAAQQALSPVLAPVAPEFMARHFPVLPDKKKGELRTSISSTLQFTARSMLTRLLAGTTDLGTGRAAALILDNRNGEILAWVSLGGKDDQVVASQPAGTILRPWLYALALEKGRSPADLVFDRVAGDVQLQYALAANLNGPAAELEKTFEKPALYDFLLKQRLVWAPADSLATYKLRLYDLVLAQATFYRGGTNLVSSALQGNSPQSPESVLTSRTASFVADILRSQPAITVDVGLQRPSDLTFGANIVTAAGQDGQPAWCLASTPEFTVGLWVGAAEGGQLKAPLDPSGLVRVAAAQLSLIPGARPKIAPPSDSYRVQLCSVSGGLATDQCPLAYEAYLPNGVKQPADCQVHSSQADRKTLRTPVPGPRGTEHPMEVLAPVSGAVYKLDGKKPIDKQIINLQASTALITVTAVWLDGKKVGQLDTKGQFNLPVQVGDHLVELRDGNLSLARVPYTVKP